MFTCKRLTPCSPVGRDKADTTVSKIRTPLHAPQAQSPTHSSSSRESTRCPAQASQSPSGALSVGGEGQQQQQTSSGRTNGRLVVRL